MQSDLHSRACCRRRPHLVTAYLAAAAVVVALVASSALLDAQSPAPTPIQSDSQAARPGPQAIQPGSQAARPGANQAQAQPLVAKPSPSTPAPPALQLTTAEQPRPDWPVNNKPAPAKITWDSHGLTVEADNSSLAEILKEVATETGAKLDGKVGDERVFGSYGPGPARDIITQLLDGTAYNVLMAGDQGEGTPRQIVLSNRPSGPAPANGAQNNNEDESEYEQPQQPIPGIPPVRNGFGAPGMPEQNQQMEERRAEMEQRREQLQQQQLEQQQQQPQTQQAPPQ